MSKPTVTRETIIQEIRRIAREGKLDVLSRSDFEQKSGVSGEQIYRHFDGWREACQVAGLKPHLQNVRLDDGLLFEEMRRVFVECGTICTQMKFARMARYNVRTYQKHFGKWQLALLEFQKWLQESGLEFSLREQLQLAVKGEVKSPTAAKDSLNQVDVQWKSRGGTTYGPFLNFRGLQHAPINEQGVVFLFGMICFELGFMVEAVRTGYPDCEAKRRVHRQRDEWERVKIEFEFKSSAFKEHGHDPKDCNLIVCWEHDWPECPLEVVELKSEISKLNDTAASKTVSRR